MISRIRGTLLRRDPGQVELLTPGGVAYEIEIPLRVYERLPPLGQEVELRTYYVVREDAHMLCGFTEARERTLFSQLLAASGVGPRLALAILSNLSPDNLIRAVGERDADALCQVPGIGRKKAERLLPELSDRLDGIELATLSADSPGKDAAAAVSALVALGYSSAPAAAAVRRALNRHAALEGNELIKAALVEIAGG